MTDPKLRHIVTTFHRQMTLVWVVRVVAIILMAAGIISMVVLPTETHRQWVFGGMMGLVFCWVLLAARSIRIAREIQAGSVLMHIGRLDDAEVWLQRGLSRFSLSARAKFVAGETLAALLFRRGDYAQTAELCQLLLRQRLNKVLNLAVNVRLLLADSLLRMDRPAEAHEVILAAYNEHLPLEARMRLLPIELRYELAANRTDAAVGNLAAKLQIAELLDSPGAAFVHALLAEACRRENMPAQQDFLTERAALYHDLDELASTWPIIAPIAAAAPDTPPSADTGE